MATNVQFSTSSLNVKKGGITLTITDDGNGRIGRIKISNAKFTWIPSDQQKGYVLSWKDLGELAAKNGTKEQ